jgi:uncharacterized DUF497 family protein
LTFDWDDANRDHLARHGITPEEVEQVFSNGALELTTELHPIDGVHIRYIGETANGRILIVVSTWRGSSLRVFTGWDAPRSAKLRYLQHRIENDA